MSICIDQPMWPRHGTVFAHLVSDESLDELHRFAAAAGVHPRAFHGDHYDIPEERYAEVLAAGAAPVSGAELLRRLEASGLRLRKRRGDDPVARLRAVTFADGQVADIDLVASGREMTGVVFAAMVFVQDQTGRFAVVHSPRRSAWGSPGGWLEAGETPAQAAVREVQEETGVVLRLNDIRPVAYERFNFGTVVSGRWLPGRSYLQVYAAQLTGAGPQLQGALDDVDGWRWVDRAQFAQLCGDEFWWPLVPHLFGVS